MRRIILSRKGFDSSSGGTASPIFPDDKIFSIPIPSKVPSPHKYSDLKIHGISGEAALREATVSSVSRTDYCHFDPDLRTGVGLFGQANSSQSELRNREVEKDDLFLFFGWFRRCSSKEGDIHHLFGWLQIEDILTSDTDIKNYLKQRGLVHPHGFGEKSNYPNNALYIGRERIDLSGIEKKLPGYGVFKKTSADLILTEKGKTRSHWRFPKKYFSKSKDLFLNRLKWKNESECTLECKGQGQEYILNAEDNPRIITWALSLIEKHC
jgi:hypothetical protein